jgi:hypothetical protein
MLSEVLRAGHEPTARLSHLSTPDSILMSYQKLVSREEDAHEGELRAFRNLEGPMRFPVPLEKFLTVSQSACFHDTVLSHLCIPLTS